MNTHLRVSTHPVFARECSDRGNLLQLTPFLLVAIAAAGCARAKPNTSEPAGLPLTAWTQIGAAEWHITNGLIEPRLNAGAGFFATKASYSDFSLHAEFWIAPDTNSGIFIRCNDRDDVSPKTCYEVNIWDEHPNQDFRTGSIVTVSKPSAIVGTLGQWNVMEIEARGDRITVTVNDVTTADINDDALAGGFIALQYAGTGAVRFRNLVIESK